MKTNKLPEYFIVKNNGSEKFKAYIEWLNKTYQTKWNGDTFKWYGFDGRSDNNGTNGWGNPENFKNNPVQLTAKEFWKLMNEPEFTEGELIEVWQDESRPKNPSTRYFITRLSNGKFFVVYDYERFLNNYHSVPEIWNHAAKITSPNFSEISMEEIAEKFGIPVEQIRIKKDKDEKQVPSES